MKSKPPTIDQPEIFQRSRDRGFFVKLPGTALSEEQMKTHLANIPEMSWVALNQLLASRQLLAVGDARDGKSEVESFKAAGRIAENSELVGDLWRLAGKDRGKLAGSQ